MNASNRRDLLGRIACASAAGILAAPAPLAAARSTRISRGSARRSGAATSSTAAERPGCRPRRIRRGRIRGLQRDDDLVAEHRPRRWRASGAAAPDAARLRSLKKASGTRRRRRCGLPSHRSSGWPAGGRQHETATDSCVLAGWLQSRWHPTLAARPSTQARRAGRGPPQRGRTRLPDRRGYLRLPTRRI